jgi:uncharacterized protein
MLVGLISDTRDRIDAMSIAVQMLLGEGAEYFLHCGDLGSRRALEPLNGLAAGFVWGDEDKDRMGLLRYGDTLQVQCFGVLGDFVIDEKRIAITHGDDKKLIKRLLREGQHDFLLHGHVNETRDEMQGKTRIIAPGVLHGGSVRTVVLLDTSTGSAKVLRVPT